MKKVFILIMNLPFLLNLSCVPSSILTGSGQPPIIIQQSSEDDEDSRTGRSSRSRSKKYTGSRGSRCEKDEDCFDICDDLYDNDGAVEDCGELRASTVREMERLIDAIKKDDITVRELVRIDDNRIFEEIMKISAYPWVYTVKRRVSRASHAKTILAWVGSNSHIRVAITEHGGQSFSSKYRPYEGIAHLSNEVNSNDKHCLSYCNVLKNNSSIIIGAGQNFRGIVGGDNWTKDTSFTNLFNALPSNLSDDDSSTCSKFHYHSFEDTERSECPSGEGMLK